MTIRVTNIVCTCNLNTSVYLPKFIIHYPFCEWNREYVIEALRTFIFSLQFSDLLYFLLHR